MASERRGEQEVRQYAAAMLHQLDLNKSKGDWLKPKLEEDRPVTPGDLVWDVFYHLIKLALASKEKAPEPLRLQEYAVDVGNCAMFVGDHFKVLDTIYMSNEHSVTQEDDFELLHEFSLDVINLLKKYKVLPEDWVDDLPISEQGRKKADEQQ